MRSISSKYELKKAQKRNQWAIGGVLIFLMLASTLGFAFQGGFSGGGGTTAEENTVVYNGFQFENVNNFWVLGSFVFRYNPLEVSDIGLELKNLDDYRNKTTYVYSESPQAESELIVNLGQFTDIESVSNESSRDCSDNFIIIKESSNSKIEQEENCVYIEARNQVELVENTDQFLFKIFGIRQ